MSTSEPLVRRKAALRAAQRRQCRAVAAMLGAMAAEAMADSVVRGFRLPRGAIFSGRWPLPDELDPRPAMDRLAELGDPLGLRVQGGGRPLAFHTWRRGDALFAGPFGVLEPSPPAPVMMLDAVATERHLHRFRARGAAPLATAQA